MKAIYYPAWDELELRDVPEPSLKPGEVVVRVAAVGICGSELHGFVTHAARLLKISRKGLQLKMKELDLRERDDE